MLRKCLSSKSNVFLYQFFLKVSQQLQMKNNKNDSSRIQRTKSLVSNGNQALWFRKYDFPVLAELRKCKTRSIDLQNSLKILP